MRRATLAAIGVIALVAGGVAVVALSGGGPSMTPLWISDTATDTRANHHAPAAGAFGNDALVYAPVSGATDSPNCALVALDAANGTERWSEGVPNENCTIHAVADPTLADFDGDGSRELIAATTERAVFAHDPLDGSVEFRYNLSSYGYTKPIVADLAGDDGRELVVVDAKGTVYVVHPDGETAWTAQLDSYTFGQPAVADFDGDRGPELAVAVGGDGGVRLFEPDGTTRWTRSTNATVTWMTTGQADDDAAVEVVVATSSGGRVTAFDGASGETEWSRDLGAFAAVHALGDGDGDGDPEVYATARDGVLRALAGADGETEWTTALTAADVQMMPPPAMGDVDGDGDPELVAPSNDGVVSVVDPDSGAVLVSHEREATVYTRPVLTDTDGDGDVEAYVVYADGRIGGFDFAAS